MKINEAGLKLLKEFEGFRSNPYPDPGTGSKPYTIGYGSTRYADGTPVTLEDKPIDEPTASSLLQNLLDTQFCPQVQSLIKVKVTDNQFSAAVAFCYNVGVGNLKQSTFLRCLNAMNWKDAADSLLLWNKSGGKIMPGLVRRREAERTLFLTA